jgi:hypothetical protein
VAQTTAKRGPVAIAPATRRRKGTAARRRLACAGIEDGWDLGSGEYVVGTRGTIAGLSASGKQPWFMVAHY